MPRICAWCGIDLDTENASEDLGTEQAAGNPLTADPAPKGPSDAAGVTSTICRRCANNLAAYRKPVLVVSREWARMYDQLVELLKGHPEIQLILDRRQPLGAEEKATGWNGPERRKKRQPLVLE